MKLQMKRSIRFGLSSVLMGTMALIVLAATDFPTFRGDNTRTGRQSGDPQQDSPGRTLIRWWDPVRSIENELDNWEIGFGVSFNAADWLQPDGTTRAFNSVLKQNQVGRAEYRYAYLTDSLNADQYWVPNSGTAKTFSWTFSVNTGDEVQLWANIPSGPTEVTDVTAPAGPGLYYPQRYYVYEISGVENADNPGQPLHEKLDTYISGGYMRLGNGGLPTDKVYKATGTQITLTLLNTIPKDSQGLPSEDRPNALVYADAAKVVQASDSGGGETVASPVVGFLNGDTYPFRVLGTRNDTVNVQVSSDVVETKLGIVTSYRHNGLKIDSAEPGMGGDVQRNMIWSWPAKRAFDDTTAEHDRYVTERANWINGTDIGGLSRAVQSVNMDNRSAGVTASSGWSVSSALPGYRGGDYFTTATVSGSATERVFYRPDLPAGDYTIDVWVPSVNTTSAQFAEVEIRRGATLLGLATVNMQTPAGWHRLKLGAVQSFASDLLAPLEVAITNKSSDAGDAGTSIIADSVRFNRTADLSIRSTPVFARIPVDTGSGVQTKDVALVAMENGRVYCLDASGLQSGGAFTGRTQVYWVYPSEKPEGSDPNSTSAEDGAGGVATMPTGFDLSSALVATVQTGPLVTDTENLLYIGSKNGRVYCLETQGRGDGTTRRRWTWPDDYPSAVSNLSVGPITGSVTMVKAASGASPAKDTLLVPTAAGRLYALDAAGNSGSRTTTITWQYPAASSPTGIGAITMTPASDFGKVFFGTASSRFYALDLDDTDGDGTANLSWSSDGTGSIAPFGAFASSSPVLVSAATVLGGMADTVYVANSNKCLYAMDASTGAFQWSTNELPSSPSGSLGFTFMNTYTNLGTLDYVPLSPPVPQGRPVIVVPMYSGQVKSFFARTDDVNKASVGVNALGLRDAGGYRLDAGTATSIAFGGKQTGWTPPLPQYDEEYNFMYVADSGGTIYAFGDDPDLSDSDLILTPGTPPVQVEVPVNDPTNDVLNQISQNARVALLLPAEYEQLQKDMASGVQPTYGALTTLTSGFDRSKVTRSAFDFGETMYVLVYNLPNPNATSPSVNYQMKLDVNAANQPTRTQFGPLYPVNDPDDSKNYASIMAVPLTGTGSSGLAPGSFNIIVSATSTRQGRGTANLTVRNTNYKPGRTYQLANPIALSRLTNPALGGVTDNIGYTTDPRNAEVIYNGSYVDTGVHGAPPQLRILRQGFAPRLQDVFTNAVNYISHGTTASSMMNVIDRSAMTMIYGPGRGLQNVRFRGSDMVWKQTDANDLPVAGDFRVKTLNSAIYAGYEDSPQGEELNTSLDYPNLRRDTLSVTKDENGTPQNPIFQPVQLYPPDIADLTSYRTTAAGYNVGVPRSLNNTPFMMDLDVPKYQPPTRQWYEGKNRVYVDPTGQLGSSFSVNSPFAYREFRSRADIDIDERLVIGTPTVDLGSVPQGALYTPGQLPAANANLLNDPQFQSSDGFTRTFSVWNDGNVNMLNVRLGKAVQGDPTRRMLFSDALNDSSWLDAGAHLHSDLDPEFTPLAYQNKRIIQKSRVGDGAATRLRLTPPRRGNPNLGIADTGAPPINVPKVAVSVPIGQPVGVYGQMLFAFEDSDAVTASVPTIKVVSGSGANAIYESYSDPGFSLKFKVREARLTTRKTAKGSRMLDDGTVPGDQRFLWANQEPAAYRDASGNMIVAFSSNRQLAGGGPGWPARLRLPGDVSTPTPFYLYIGSIGGDRPSNAQPGISPLHDLEGWRSAAAGRWGYQNLTALPTGTLESLFVVPAGYTIDPNSVRFGLPAFPAMGPYDPLQFFPGRGVTNNVYMAFVGEATKVGPNGDATPVAMLFIASVSTNSNGEVAVNSVQPLTANGQTVIDSAHIGRPSVLQSGENATVFFTTTSGGLQQVNYALFDGTQWVTQGNRAMGSLGIGSSFESISSVSGVLRRQAAAGRLPMIQVAITGKLRGRANSDVYFASIVADNRGRPRPTGNSLLQPWQLRFERLDYDNRTSTYWSHGAELIDSTTAVTGVPVGPVTDPTADQFIDIMRRVSGRWESVLDHNTKTYDQGSRLLTVDTIFGGQAQIDLASGSVKFTGALIPKQATLYLRSQPKYARISESNAMNYTGAQVAYDDRYQSELNYAGAQGYQFNGGQLYDPNAAGMTQDRFIFTYNKSANVANGATVVRPHVRTLRFGLQLPTPPATNQNGYLVNFRVNGMAPGSFYQVDPVGGRLFVTAANEFRSLDITYTAYDTNGNTVVIRTIQSVGFISEGDELVVPIDQPANESPVALALDPFSAAFSSNSNLRPGLIWMFWSSTRDGTPDLFFQSWSPKLAADPASRN